MNQCSRFSRLIGLGIITAAMSACYLISAPANVS
jgi:hypothetical protein